jgi:outer membrane protein TolC
MKKLISCIVFIWMSIASIMAQDAETADSSFLILPSLTIVIDSALRNSPLLKAKEMNADMIDQDIKIEKKKWMDYLSIEGATNYGLFDQVVISGITTSGSTTTGALSKSQQVRYYGGLSLKLPLSSITSRHNALTKKQIAREQYNLELLQAQNDVRQTVIEEYYKLKYLEESMKTFQSICQTMQISYMKAEKDVLNNRMGLNAFALLASSVGKAKDDYSKVRNNFYAQYYKLQNLTGVNFTTKY